MSFALIHTSAPRGLLPNTRGFTTVAVTEGIPPTWRERLESLSAYESSGPGVSRRPTCHAHFRAEVAGNTRSVVTRIVPAGLDYSGRPNRLAHHILVEPDEMPAAGPAWLLAQDGLFRDTWDEQPHTFAEGPRIPAGDVAPQACHRWEQITGDAGWGGSLIAALREDSKRPVFLIYPPGTDVLALLSETVALLAPADRWEASWCTYFSQIPPNTTCSWRCVVAGSSAARDVTRTPGSKIIDLSTTLARAPDNPFTLAARRGEFVPQYREAGRIVTPGERIVAPAATLTPEPPAQELKPLPLEPERLDLFAAQTARRTPVLHPTRQETHERGPGRWLLWLGGPAVATAVIVTLMTISGPDADEGRQTSEESPASETESEARTALTEPASDTPNSPPNSERAQTSMSPATVAKIASLQDTISVRDGTIARLKDDIEQLKADASQPPPTPARVEVATPEYMLAWRAADGLDAPPSGRFLGAVDLSSSRPGEVPLWPSPPIYYATLFPKDGKPTLRKSTGNRIEATSNESGLTIKHVKDFIGQDPSRSMLDQISISPSGMLSLGIPGPGRQAITSSDDRLGTGIILLNGSPDGDWQFLHYNDRDPTPIEAIVHERKCEFDIRGKLSYDQWHLAPPWNHDGSTWTREFDSGLVLEVTFDGDRKVVVTPSTASVELMDDFEQLAGLIKSMSGPLRMLKGLEEDDTDVRNANRLLESARKELCEFMASRMNAWVAKEAGEPIIVHDEWGFPRWKLEVEFGALGVKLPPSCPGASRTPQIQVPQR